MAGLRGHATDPPGRWQEPGAVPAADHATQRAHQGRGRHQTRRRVRRQCRERDEALGSLIPHADAIGALVIAMIEATLGTALMTLSSGTHGCLARRRATHRRAIRVAAITRHADRKDAIAASTDFLAKRPIHDVEAAARFDWTRRSNHGTRETTGSVRRSIEAVTEGLELHLQAFISIPAASPSAYNTPATFEGAFGGSCSPTPARSSPPPNACTALR